MSTNPAPAAVATIAPVEAAASDRSPQPRSIATAASASRGPWGRRTVGRSDIVRTPPGRNTRNASRKNRSRDGKWKAASTLITPSKEPSANGRSQASAQMPRAPASRNRSRPASSWDHVMFTAVSERGCTVVAITGS
jgi:hypothetical protein